MRVRCVNEVPGACKGGTVVASTSPQEADLGWESGLRRSHAEMTGQSRRLTLGCSPEPESQSHLT